MSSAVAPSVSYDHETVHDKKDAPRKRSKVSRACDACRRKKVRCNGEYSSVYQKVTKICTNCVKASELCTFSRVPLKRGPSKGSMHMDPVDHTEYGKDSSWRPRSKSMDTAQYSTFTSPQSNGSGRFNTPPSPISSSQAKPTLHRPKLASASSTSPIILPPLIGTQHQTIKLNLNGSHSVGSPLSPPHITNGKPGDLQDTVVKGPLWKVPYEMPTSGGQDSNASSPGMSAMDFDSRRSSIDSISSISSAGSRSRLPSLQPSLSAASDFAKAEADESGMSSNTSPRNSISSLSSLNGRVANTLTLNSYPKPISPHTLNGPQMNYSSPQVPYVSGTPGPAPQMPFKTPSSLPMGTSFPQAPMQAAFYHIPFNSLEYNSHLYHIRFQGNLPILPFDETLIVRLVSDMQKNAGVQFEVAQIFNTALNNMINYQLVPCEAHSSLLLRTMNFYSSEKGSISSHDNVLVVLCIALSLINYAMLLKGEACSMGVSLLGGIFHDSKVANALYDMKASELSEKQADEKTALLLRLLLCSHIIDACSSLSQGSQCQLPPPLDALLHVVTMLIPTTFKEIPFIFDLKVGEAFIGLNELKRQNSRADSLLAKSSELLSKISSGLPSFSFAAQFLAILQDKYDLFHFMSAVTDTISTLDASSTPGINHNKLAEQNIQMSKLVKKLSQSIMNFANYISSIYMQAKSASNNKASLLNNPYFNVSFGHCLKLIYICKVSIDSVQKHIKDDEVLTRTIKVYNDLSIAFNLMVSHMNSKTSLIETAKNSLTTQSQLNGGNSVLSLPESMDISGLGITYVGFLTKRVASYNMNFYELPQVRNETAESLSSWVDEYRTVYESTVLLDRSQSWG